MNKSFTFIKICKCNCHKIPNKLSIYNIRSLTTNSYKNQHKFSILQKIFFVGLSAGGLLGLRYNSISAAQKPKEDNVKSSHSMNIIADVVEIAAPAVVVIEIESRHPITMEKFSVSNGSGFIVREDGVILTNAHVVADNNSVHVRLKDGRVLKGIVQAVDTVSDLATIKVDAKGLPVLPLGISEKLRAGEFVVAMGSPLRLNNTVTAGIVSSTNRKSKDLGYSNNDINYIQTDAGINFGNSGGPLINLDGEAIGINTLTAAAGISFAIPSDYAKIFLQKVEQIEERGGISSGGWFKSRKSLSPRSRKYLGVTMVTLNKDLIQTLKLTQPDISDVLAGVLVYSVADNSPASNAGLMPGDIIVSINNSQVKHSSDVHNCVEASVNIQLTVRRGANTFNFDVPLVHVR